jgi:hypothetical protein
LELGRVQIPALLPNQNYQTMKQTLIAIVIIALSAIQGLFIGLNGLTIISIPMTIYLGLLVIEKITEKQKEINN